MATITDNSTVLAQAIMAKIVANQQTLKVRDVLYGEQIMIPRSPTVVVLLGTKTRILAGVSAPGGRTENDMTVLIDIHSMKVGDEATERLAMDQLAESVEKLLHADTQMGGLLIHGFVTEYIPGETVLQNGEFRTVRLTYIGRSKTYLTVP